MVVGQQPKIRPRTSWSVRYCFGPLINNTWTTKNNSDVENLSRFTTPVNRNPSTERFVTDRWVLMTASTAPIRAILDRGARFMFAVRTEKTRTLEFLRVLYLARDGEDDTRNTVGWHAEPKQTALADPAERRRSTTRRVPSSLDSSAGYRDGDLSPELANPRFTE